MVYLEQSVIHHATLDMYIHSLIVSPSVKIRDDSSSCSMASRGFKSQMD